MRINVKNLETTLQLRPDLAEIVKSCVTAVLIGNGGNKLTRQLLVDLSILEPKSEKPADQING